VWAVTRPLVQAAAQRYFDPEKVVEGVVRGVIAGRPDGGRGPS
jgi:hypothetical protein